MSLYMFDGGNWMQACSVGAPSKVRPFVLESSLSSPHRVPRGALLFHPLAVCSGIKGVDRV